MILVFINFICIVFYYVVIVFGNLKVYVLGNFSVLLKYEVISD